MLIHRLKIALALGCLALAVLVLRPLSTPSRAQDKKAAAQATPTPTPKAPIDYSRFTHQSHTGQVKIPGTQATRELNCNYCHERIKAGTPMPEFVPTTERNKRFAVKFPGHRACADCHVQQFTAQPPQTCAICHDEKQGLTARPPQRDFPERRSYNAFFDAQQHEKHAGYKLADGKALSCNFCHTPTQRGLAVTIASHQECYVCHAPASSEQKASVKTDCAVCHTQMTPTPPFETKYVSRAYGAKFSHREHLQHVDCSACHSIQGGYNQSSPTSIRVKEHNTAGQRGGRGCFSCHNGGRVFSGDDANACSRCHNVQGQIRVGSIRG
jgi:c(7)-type cytochrome triheme protein